MAGGFLSKLRTRLFVDLAAISMQRKEDLYPLPVSLNATRGSSHQLFTSAGFSITMPPVWSNHRVRLDFPIYQNRPLPGEHEWKFRFSVAWTLDKTL